MTGHSGFKGSWLCLWLESLGAKVTGYSLALPTTPDHFSHLGLSGNYITGDIRDASALDRAVAGAKPEIVFHLAAQPLVRLSYSDPVETYSTNVMGTLYVFEAARKAKCVRAIVNVTSDKCYENRETTRGYRESDPMGGHDPYSSSKGCAEILTASYRRSYFSDDGATQMASGRAGNVIGGGDWAADRLIPDIVRATQSGRATLIRNPQSVRPWQHVLEPLHGYLKLGARLLDGERSAAEGWNFGPAIDDSRNVEALALLFQKEWSKAKFEFGTPGDATGDATVHEAGLLRLDISKAEIELGWKPILSLEETVRWTADWYRGFVEKKEVLSRGQLAAFQEKL